MVCSHAIRGAEGRRNRSPYDSQPADRILPKGKGWRRGYPGHVPASPSTSFDGHLANRRPYTVHLSRASIRGRRQVHAQSARQSENFGRPAPASLYGGGETPAALDLDGRQASRSRSNSGLQLHRRQPGTAHHGVRLSEREMSLRPDDRQPAGSQSHLLYPCRYPRQSGYRRNRPGRDCRGRHRHRVPLFRGCGNAGYDQNVHRRSGTSGPRQTVDGDHVVPSLEPDTQFRRRQARRTQGKRHGLHGASLADPGNRPHDALLLLCRTLERADRRRTQQGNSRLDLQDADFRLCRPGHAGDRCPASGSGFARP